MLQHSIKTKHYLYSVRQILKYEEMLEREELRNIAALEEIRQSIKEHKTVSAHTNMRNTYAKLTSCPIALCMSSLCQTNLLMS